MNKFNYMGAAPYSNPAGYIAKTTNEIPVEKKTATKTKKARKSTKRAKKTKKTADTE